MVHDVSLHHRSDFDVMSKMKKKRKEEHDRDNQGGVSPASAEAGRIFHATPNGRGSGCATAGPRCGEMQLTTNREVSVELGAIIWLRGVQRSAIILQGERAGGRSECLEHVRFRPAAEFR